MISKRTFTACTLALLLVGSPSVMANSFSFTGNFTNDSEVQYFDFSLTTDSTTVIINTLSLNGGFNLAGELIATGGFNPYLSLWDQSTGAWVFDTLAKNIGSEAIISNTAPYSYGTLLAGNYILALSQYDNVAWGTNLSNGFAADHGFASFDPISPFTTNGGGGRGHWAVDIQNVARANISAVPLPGSFGFIISGLLAIASLTRRKLSVGADLSAPTILIATPLTT